MHNICSSKNWIKKLQEEVNEWQNMSERYVTTDEANEK